MINGNIFEIDDEGFLVNDSGVRLEPSQIENFDKDDVLYFLSNSFAKNTDNKLCFRNLLYFTIKYHNLLNLIDVPDSFRFSHICFMRNMTKLISRFDMADPYDSNLLIESKLVFDSSNSGFFWKFDFIIDSDDFDEESVFDIYIADENGANEFNMDDLLISEIFNSNVVFKGFDRIGLIHIIRIIDGVVFLNLMKEPKFSDFDEREGLIMKNRQKIKDVVFEVSGEGFGR